MIAALGILTAGSVLAWIAWQVLDEVEERYEARTGRDWTTGEPK
jgi:hypothetical protein